MRAAGSVFAEDEAALLVDAGRDPADLARLVERREAGEPLELVLGWAELCGVRVEVAPGVFVPRRRTGLVVREAVTALDTRCAGVRVLVDLCCGTGAVAAVVATLAAPGAPLEVHAADIDPAAARVARRNVPGEVHSGDLYDALPARLRGHVDVLAVNAPYVPTEAIATMPPEARVHEPRTALDGGSDGLALHRRVADGAAVWLRPGGVLVLETSTTQRDLSAGLLRRAGLRTRVVRDDDLDGTVVVGVRPTCDG
nr:putative protein N(5)-glutamine methyltransferase [Cellulomonas sp. APG4]